MTTTTKRPTTTVHVHRGRRWVGSLHIDARGRLLRRDPDVPADVALLALLRLTRRAERAGVVTALDGGADFTWRAGA